MTVTSDPSFVRDTQTVGDSRSPGAAPRAHPLGSARVGSRCGQRWWSALGRVGGDILIRRDLRESKSPAHMPVDLPEY